MPALVGQLAKCVLPSTSLQSVTVICAVIFAFRLMLLLAFAPMLLVVVGLSRLCAPRAAHHALTSGC
jgi:hypothetical protein